MLIVYAILIGFIMGCLFYTRNYKKQERLNLLKRNRIWDGLGLFIVDVFLKDKQQSEIFRKIHPDKDYILEKRIFRTKQISTGILLLFAFLLLGLFHTILVAFEEEKAVTSIRRPDNGQGTKEVELEVRYDDEEKDIILQVDEYQLTEEEILEKIEQVYEKVKQSVLGKNEAFGEITEDFDFSIEEVDSVSVQYAVAADGFVQADGCIDKSKVYDFYEDNKVDSVESYIELFISYGEVSKNYQIDVGIRLPENTRSFEELVKDEIDEVNSQNNREMILPDTIDDKNISFFEKKEEDSAFYLILGLAGIILGIFSKNEELKSKLTKRNQQLEQDYAAVVNKLTLLTGAGTTMLGAWDRVIQDFEKNKDQYGYRYVYEEMKVTRKRMHNGISEAEAYSEFGRRCDSTAYIKLGCLLEQNIRKGTKGLNDCLNQEVREAFVERKILAKKRGEEAATKLLLPMMLMLIISMVIVLVPAFLSMSI